jgi:hypothetical protein
MAAVAHLGESPPDGEERLVTIGCVGREFVTRLSMADVFLSRSSNVIADGGSELVPLLHQDGLEMIFVSGATEITVTDFA